MEMDTEKIVKSISPSYPSLLFVLCVCHLCESKVHCDVKTHSQRVPCSQCGLIEARARACSCRRARALINPLQARGTTIDPLL